VGETKVVHLRRDAYDVRIDRRTPLGNPFQIGVDGNRYAVIEQHMKYWRGLFANPRKRKWALEQLRSMKGKRLGCHCAPLPCHGDNYVRLIAEFCP
jgi:hypothetical protein